MSFCGFLICCLDLVIIGECFVFFVGCFVSFICFGVCFLVVGDDGFMGILVYGEFIEGLCSCGYIGWSCGCIG